MLQHLGFEVDFANEGEKALSYYAQALEQNAPYRRHDSRSHDSRRDGRKRDSSTD